MQKNLTRQLLDLATNVVTRVVIYVWLAVTALAAVSGPFGTYLYLDFATRLTYWGVIVGISILVPRSVQVVVRDRFPERPRWQNEAISVTLIVPILTALIWTLTPQMLSVDQSSLPPPAVLAGFVLTVAFVVVGLQRFWDYLKPEVVPDAVVRPGPRLKQRLTNSASGEILRLTGRDHMVEVITSDGGEAIRMRFTDAINEMEPVEGYCAHRSHWVTRDAIVGVEREPGKVFLRLVNGDRVPVSRKYRPGLEEAGIV